MLTKPMPRHAVVGGGGPGGQPGAFASGSAEPGHGRTCSGHGAWAASWPSVILTGTVFRPQLMVGSVGMSDLSTDKPEVEDPRGLGAAVRVEATGRIVP